MPNCFQVDGKSLTGILKSLSEVKVVDASDCGQISLMNAKLLSSSGLEISTRKLAKCEWFFEVASLKNIL